LNAWNGLSESDHGLTALQHISTVARAAKWVISKEDLR